MLTKKLKDFIAKESDRLIKNYGGSSDYEKRVLSRTVKMQEEVGELCEEILASQNDQRKEKLKKHNQETMEGEFSDVLITVMLLAEILKIDLDEALNNKIKKNDKRYKKH